MINAPTIANILRNTAYTIKLGRLHEPAVLWTEHALRTGPLVRTEFDGITISDNVYVSEVKKRKSLDSIALLDEIRKVIDDFEKRIKYIKKASNKPVKPKIVIFHNTIIDTGYILDEVGSMYDLELIPIKITKLPATNDEEIRLIVDALLIEFISLPRLTCKKFAPTAIGCYSPPYDVLIEDIKDAIKGNPPGEFAEWIQERAADPENLKGLHPCQALYAVATALRISGRRMDRYEVIENYKKAIEYVLSIPVIKDSMRNIDKLIVTSVLELINYLDGETESVRVPKAPQRQQVDIPVECICEEPERILVLLTRELGEESMLSDILINAFPNAKEYYFIDRHVRDVFDRKFKSRYMKVRTNMVSVKNIDKADLPSDVYVVSTDLFLSYKRNRRIMRNIEDYYHPKSILVFHRGIVPPSVEKIRTRGRHSLEVM